MGFLIQPPTNTSANVLDVCMLGKVFLQRRHCQNPGVWTKGVDLQLLTNVVLAAPQKADPVVTGRHPPGSLQIPAKCDLLAFMDSVAALDVDNLVANGLEAGEAVEGVTDSLDDSCDSSSRHLRVPPLFKNKKHKSYFEMMFNNCSGQF